MDDENDQNSFTIEIQAHEEYDKKVLQKFRENLWLYGKINRYPRFVHIAAVKEI